MIKLSLINVKTTKKRLSDNRTDKIIVMGIQTEFKIIENTNETTPS